MRSENKKLEALKFHPHFFSISFFFIRCHSSSRVFFSIAIRKILFKL